MNRRSFLGRAILGAAAILGAGAVPQVAEEAPALKVADDADILTQPKDVVLKDGTLIDGGRITTSGNVVIDGKDIAVTNCLIQSAGITVTSTAQRVVLMNNTIMGARSEALVADARAEGYAAGYTQATQRAESRAALGLSPSQGFLYLPDDVRQMIDALASA